MLCCAGLLHHLRDQLERRALGRLGQSSVSVNRKAVKVRAWGLAVTNSVISLTINLCKGETQEWERAREISFILDRVTILLLLLLLFITQIRLQ